MIFESFERLSDGLEDGLAGDAFTGVADEACDPPAGGLDGLGVAYPTQIFLDPPRRVREQVSGLEFGQITNQSEARCLVRKNANLWLVKTSDAAVTLAIQPLAG